MSITTFSLDEGMLRRTSAAPSIRAGDSQIHTVQFNLAQSLSEAVAVTAVFRSSALYKQTTTASMLLAEATAACTIPTEVISQDGKTVTVTLVLVNAETGESKSSNECVLCPSVLTTPPVGANTPNSPPITTPSVYAQWVQETAQYASSVQQGIAIANEQIEQAQQANETSQEAIVHTQGLLADATTQVAQAAAYTSDSAQQVVLAAQQVELATEQVTLAAAQVDLAEEQVTLASAAGAEQVTLAATQVELATQKAETADTYKDAAAESAALAVSCIESKFVDPESTTLATEPNKSYQFTEPLSNLAITLPDTIDADYTQAFTVYFAVGDTVPEISFDTYVVQSNTGLNTNTYYRMAVAHIGEFWQASYTALGDYIPYTTFTGEGVISVQNTVNAPIKNLTLYGKSTQDGTPTPDAPVDIVSVGDDGEIAVTVCGKNLLNFDAIFNEETDTALGTMSATDGCVTITSTGMNPYTQTGMITDGTLSTSNQKYAIKLAHSTAYTMSYTTEVLNGTVFYYSSFITLFDADFNVTRYFSQGDTGEISFTTAENEVYCTQRLGFYLTEENIGTTVQFSNIMLEVGESASDYQPYTEYNASVTLSEPLRGLKVGSGGNYTDSTGQQWICDTYHAETGVITRNCAKIIFDGTENWYWGFDETAQRARLYNLSTSNVYYNGEAASVQAIISEQYLSISPHATLYDSTDGISTQSGHPIIQASNYDNVADWKVHLAELCAAGRPLVIVYQLTPPVIEQLENNIATTAHLGATTIHNDETATMQAELIAQTNIVI